MPQQQLELSTKSVHYLWSLCINSREEIILLNIFLSDFEPVNRVLRASVVRLSLVGERKNAVSPDSRRAADGLTFCKLFLLTMNCALTYC